MSLFLMGLIIFCCGICYRIILIASKIVENNNADKAHKDDEEEITNKSETKTTTGGIE
jgi:hypothetical protein